MSGGFKCYTKKALESLDFDRFISKDYSIGAETLYRLYKKGFRIKEIPVIFIDRKKGKSKCDFKVMLNYVVKIFEIKIKEIL
jgi:dolichol-phosphate mannosyltransferase